MSGFTEALQIIEDLLACRHPCYVVTPNVDHLMRLQWDNQFHDAYRHAALVLADGMPVLWAARLLGAPLKAKISGSDLFPALCRVAATKGYRVFLLGGSPGVATAAASMLCQAHPSLSIVGTYAPPCGFEQDPIEALNIVDVVHTAVPDLLFVGLGAPKQELFLSRYHRQLGGPVSIGVGVAFEFIAGVQKRAPFWMQQRGLEWVWGLLHEPRRLWMRYLIHDSQFVWLLARECWQRYRKR